MRSSTDERGTRGFGGAVWLICSDVAQCQAEGCEGSRAYFYQVQIRSADEPMTTFYKVGLGSGWVSLAVDLLLMLWLVYGMWCGSEGELRMDLVRRKYALVQYTSTGCKYRLQELANSFAPVLFTRSTGLTGVVFRMHWWFH